MALNGLPENDKLPDAELHVWRVDTSVAQESALTNLLSRTELEKAGRFRQQLDRHRSILARAALRDILGRYMNLNPRSLEFIVSNVGKPMLDLNSHPVAPHFSVSHSGSIILLAFAQNHELGVDVELIRPDIEVMSVAQQFFSPVETATLLGLPAGLRTRAFFDGWTRKEAYLKARAEGIGSGMNRFAVTLAPDEPARLLSDEAHPEQLGSWHLHHLALASEYSAAVAVQSRLRLHCCLWNKKR